MMRKEMVVTYFKTPPRHSFTRAEKTKTVTEASQVSVGAVLCTVTALAVLLSVVSYSAISRTNTAQ